jgi:hypothetical protein
MKPFNEYWSQMERDGIVRKFQFLMLTPYEQKVVLALNLGFPERVVFEAKLDSSASHSVSQLTTGLYQIFSRTIYPEIAERIMQTQLPETLQSFYEQEGK